MTGLARRTLPIVLLAVTAVALRLWHVTQGLPDFVEEALPFRRALEMWGWDTGAIDWNPHNFHYPSLSFYLHHLIQRLHFEAGHLLGRFTNPGDYYVSYLIDPTPMVVAARTLGIAADAVMAVAVALIGERSRRGAGLVAGALVVFAPALILDARSIYTDGLMAAFAIGALERMLAHRASGRRSSLIAAVVLIGLAAGTKYPAAALLLVLAWVLWDRRREKALGPALGAVAGTLLVFLVTSPFIVFDFPSFFRDFVDVGQLARQGHFGHLSGSGFAFYLRDLSRQLGALGVALAFSSVALVVGWPRREPVAVAAWIYLLALGVPIAVSRVEAERYLVPIVPVVALLAALAALEWIGRVPRRGRVIVSTLGLAALVIPVAVAGVRAAASGGDSTQLQARRWIEAHLSDHDVLVQEAYGAQLPTVRTVQHQSQRAAFAQARAELQERYLSSRTFRVVSIPLAVAGRLAVSVPLAGGGETEVEITPEVADFNRVFYDPRLLAGVDYLLTSDAVRGRYLSDPARYARQIAFYQVLDSLTAPVERFTSSDARVGPEIRIYRLDARAWSVIRARFGDLDAQWWTAFVPRRYRDQVDRLAVDRRRWNPDAVLGPEAQGSPWRTSLQNIFTGRVRTFAYDLSRHLLEVDRATEAMPLAAGIAEELPGDVSGVGLYVQVAARVGRWRDARTALSRLLQIEDPGGHDAAPIRLDYARALARTGDRDSARVEIQRVLDSAALDDDTARAARAMWAEVSALR